MDLSFLQERFPVTKKDDFEKPDNTTSIIAPMPTLEASFIPRSPFDAVAPEKYQDQRNPQMQYVVARLLFVHPFSFFRKTLANLDAGGCQLHRDSKPLFRNEN